MKKIFSLLLVAILAISLVGCGQKKPTKKLVVFNWGEYIDQDILKDFEKKFNVEVVYETFDSNEMMYTKLQSGNTYDVLIPSDYMIERLIKEKLIQPLDKSIIKNVNLVRDDALKLPYDSDNTYSVPYFMGNVGILYNKKEVKKEDLKAGWEILKNPEYKDKIYMYDSQRDSFMVALKALGYSMNTTNKAEINQAYDWLVDQQKKVKPVYVGDEVIDNMTSSNKSMAVMYSGDAASVIKENEDMDFFMPDQGVNTWYDGLVISKDSKEVKLANEFINFMINNENSYKNTEAVGYFSTNKEAAQKAIKEIYPGNSAYQVRRGTKDEVFKYQDKEILNIYNELWTKVKAS